ncbi:MAG: class I SAM-dependent methyltransferase [Actinomycetota bacterium]|nr:class I SAM-dependent methyltransferase [Actinomycetota bacterium]
MQGRVIDRFQRDALAWDSLYERADVYAQVHRLRQRLALEWTDNLALSPEARVLELGCGAGHTSVALGQRGYSVDAVDSTSAMLQIARIKIAEAGLSDVRLSLQDAHRLAFPDATYDLVVALGVVPWLHSPGIAVTEMARVLRPGGYLLANSDNRARLTHTFDPRNAPGLEGARRAIKGLLKKAGRYRPPEKALATMHRLREFDSLLENAELLKVRAVTLGFGAFTFMGRRFLSDDRSVRLHHRLQARADRGAPILKDRGNQYLVLARKAG